MARRWPSTALSRRWFSWPARPANLNSSRHRERDVSQAIPAELLAHWLDHYGRCARDNGKQNDCYHGKDGTGHDNGCLKVGWRGRICPHWTPISENELVWLIAAHTVRTDAAA